MDPSMSQRGTAISCAANGLTTIASQGMDTEDTVYGVLIEPRTVPYLRNHEIPT